MRPAPALAALLFAALAVPSDAGSLAPSRPSQIVTLMTSAVTDSACGSTSYPVDTMRKPDGSVATFVAPPKQVFVVTSMDVYGIAAQGNSHYHFSLSVESSPSIPGGALLIGDAGATDANGYYAATVTLPTGVVAPPGSLLCAEIGGPTVEPTHARVHGFFTKDK